jgi:hypothetical protein
MNVKIDQLIAALVTGQDKVVAIKNIQDFVFNSEDFSMLDERIQDILSEFAYDLDFYVSDPSMREEVPNYYGEERLNEEIEAVIKKLNSLGFNSNPNT